MNLIYGDKIKSALREVSPTQIAVAYVGKHWSNYINPDILKEIILSPTLGTNPNAVAELAIKLGWKNVHFLDNLHTKMYLGDGKAALGSFNLSENGLSASGLEEAGFIIDDKQINVELKTLFDKYRSSAISKYSTEQAKIGKLAELRAAWDRAVLTKDIKIFEPNQVYLHLSDYQVTNPSEIYVCWIDGNFEYNEDIADISTINDSVNFLEDDDIKPGRWILCWHAKADDSPDESSEPYWIYIDEVMNNGVSDEKYTQLAIQRNDRTPPPVPFELTKDAIEAIYSVLRSKKFPAFLPGMDPWSINPTIPKLADFIKAAQSELALKASTS
ncbi:phospholipase D family protein [Undibacterium sp. CY18W]|uniref:Phospholipase D family protein n=1 Tax=Undibacterium hunanense TaxID=2762292 RepID=A0ABR6ZT75_9BURK|nr:phospholipase D family protein [Undibacterium hunanense]MBC3919081.1 phospholipase D family protein [Undibacterium hunanense]